MDWKRSLCRVNKMKNKEQNKKYEEVKVEVHLNGKSSKSSLISLDDLQNLIAGINGLSKYLIKKKLGKGLKSRFDKEMQEICSLGLKNIRSGSAVLELNAFPEGQQKLGFGIDVKSIMEEMTTVIDELDIDEEHVPLEVAHYLDNLTKPLNNEDANLEISVFSKNVLIKRTKKLTINSRKKVQLILDRKKLKSGVMYGLLKELNLKDYSAKVQLLNQKLEKFYFNDSLWESIRDLLESKVEIKFEGKGMNKNLLEIKKIDNYQEKRKMTGKDLLEMGVLGTFEHRKDMGDSVAYAKKLAEDIFK